VDAKMMQILCGRAQIFDANTFPRSTEFVSHLHIEACINSKRSQQRLVVQTLQDEFVVSRHLGY